MRLIWGENLLPNTWCTELWIQNERPSLKTIVDTPISVQTSLTKFGWCHFIHWVEDSIPLFEFSHNSQSWQYWHVIQMHRTTLCIKGKLDRVIVILSVLIAILFELELRILTKLYIENFIRSKTFNFIKDYALNFYISWIISNISRNYWIFILNYLTDKL